jgi:hypothetical protein
MLHIKDEQALDLELNNTQARRNVAEIRKTLAQEKKNKRETAAIPLVVGAAIVTALAIALNLLLANH